MFANRTHGSCTSSAVFLTTALRALGIPTRMVLGIPMVDGNDPAQLAMVRDGIHHHRVRRDAAAGALGARGYANHTFNEVFVGGRWVRLNYKTLGQNILDGEPDGAAHARQHVQRPERGAAGRDLGQAVRHGRARRRVPLRQSLSMRGGLGPLRQVRQDREPRGRDPRAPGAHDQQGLLGRRPRRARHDQGSEVAVTTTTVRGAC